MGALMTDIAGTTESRIKLLAQMFPCLRKAPGISPWNALAVDDWASSGNPSHGELCTARFVLAVWDPNGEWRSGRFDLMEALPVWDLHHREAFLAWARDPWWA
jgi:hypothetical protein